MAGRGRFGPLGMAVALSALVWSETVGAVAPALACATGRGWSHAPTPASITWG